MTLHALYEKLKASYTHDNLHRITTKIITLHKNQQHHALRKILSTIEGDVAAKNEPHGKTFYQLMMVYHPDRLMHYLGEIEKQYKVKNADQLQKFSHIFSTLDLEQTLVVLKPSRSEDSPDVQYEWEEQDSGFDYRNIDRKNIESEYFDETEQYGNDFYSVLKRSIYGHENIELPYYYLEDLDSLDLSGYGIGNLDGIQHCRSLQILDLSHNTIVDISELSQVTTLQEIFLSDNRIGYIDSLSFSPNLRVIDLSDNNIDDISPLFELEKLEYVNLIGNKIPEKQRERLKAKGIVVIF